MITVELVGQRCLRTAEQNYFLLPPCPKATLCEAPFLKSTALYLLQYCFCFSIAVFEEHSYSFVSICTSHPALFDLISMWMELHQDALFLL